MFANAVTPITCNAENLACKVSIPEEIPPKLTCLAALAISSSPLEAPDKFRFCLRRCRVDILV